MRIKDDNYYMKRAISLSRRGAGMVSPNPLVGALIVKKGRVIGEGYHRRPGGGHAEVLAIEEAGKKASGATLYVTLEPCCHFGRTPPCTDRIIASGIQRVVAPMEDPNPDVGGKGFRRLRKEGIKVTVGVQQELAERTNEIYFHTVRTRGPFVLLKSALSLDGKIATSGGHSRWITSEKARQSVHRLRYEMDAVMVGIGTVLIDDPLLTVRDYSQKKCIRRIVLDTYLRMPSHSRLLKSLDEGEVIIFTSKRAPEGRKKRLEKKGGIIYSVPARKGKLSLPAVMKKVSDLGITSVLLEAGSELAWAALEAKIVTKVYFFYGTIILGGTGAPPAVGGRGVSLLRHAIRLESVKISKLGEDFLLEGRPLYK